MKKPMRFGADQSKKLFAIAMIAGMVVSFAGAAQADNDWNGHARGAQKWHKHHVNHGRYVPERRYEQEDPYVVYAPPVIVEPPSGINVVFPIHIR
jgi:hypothetical protein